MSKSDPKASPRQLTIPIGEDTVVVGRRNLWLAIFVVVLLIVGSVVATAASLRVVTAFEHANAVHRARNEASHICVVEVIGEARHRAKAGLDWTPRASVEFYDECVNRVAPSLIPPETVRSPLRFRPAAAETDAATATPTASSLAIAQPTPTPRDREIFVPYAPPSSTAPRSTPPPATRRSAPTPTRRPTPRPTPTPCPVTCVPTPPMP